MKYGIVAWYTGAHTSSLIWISRRCFPKELALGLGTISGLQRCQLLAQNVSLPSLLISFQLVVVVDQRPPRVSQVPSPKKHGLLVPILGTGIRRDGNDVLCLEF